MKSLRQHAVGELRSGPDHPRLVVCLRVLLFEPEAQADPRAGAILSCRAWRKLP
jgi:hypothetical protein